MTVERRQIINRRTIERRAPKPGVTIRHDDKPEKYLPKRIRYAKAKEPNGRTT